ncbi:MAG: alpha/beta hydrolase, partial [Planctomycetota bacterium]
MLPVLAIQGVDDEYGTQRQVDTICAGVSGPSHGVMVPDCAHIPHLQAPEAVLAEMAGFLERLPK